MWRLLLRAEADARRVRDKPNFPNFQIIVSVVKVNRDIVFFIFFTELTNLIWSKI